MLIHFPADTTELLQEDLFGMLGSLRLNVAHDFTPLTEIQICPIANVHRQDVFLREFDLGRRDEVQVLILNQRCLGNFLILNRLLDLKSLHGQLYLLLLCLLFQLLFHFLRGLTKVFLTLCG